MCGLVKSLVKEHSEMHRPVCLVTYGSLWRGKSRKKSEHDYKEAKRDEQSTKTNSTGFT